MQYLRRTFSRSIPSVRIHASLSLLIHRIHTTRSSWFVLHTSPTGHGRLGMGFAWSTYSQSVGCKADPARKTSSSPPPVLTKLRECIVDEALQGNAPIAICSGRSRLQDIDGPSAGMHISGELTSTTRVCPRKGLGQTMAEIRVQGTFGHLYPSSNNLEEDSRWPQRIHSEHLKDYHLTAADRARIQSHRVWAGSGRRHVSSLLRSYCFNPTCIFPSSSSIHSYCAIFSVHRQQLYLQIH